MDDVFHLEGKMRFTKVVRYDILLINLRRFLLNYLTRKTSNKKRLFLTLI